MKKLIIAAIIIAILYATSERNKQSLLQECIEYRGGTDYDCEQCFYEVYGHYPEETINQ